MGQTTDQPASTITVEIPGVGVRGFPASMPIEQIQANVKSLMAAAKPQGEGWDAPKVGRSVPEAMVRGFGQGAREAAGKVLTPEVTGGLAGLGVAAAGPSMGTSMALTIPAGVAAGTSLVRDYLGGESPSTMANDALGHGAVNAVPGMVGLPGVRQGLGRAAGAMLGGSKVGKITSALGELLGAGKSAAPAAADGASTMLSATLPFGEKVGTPEGLAVLKGYARDMAMKGATMGDPTYEALSTMIRHVEEHLATQAGTGTGLAHAAGVPLQYAADTAAAQAAAFKAKIATALRAVLGGASVAKQQTIGQSGQP